MAVEVAQEQLRCTEVEPSSQRGQFDPIRRQRVLLPVVHQLQRVLDGPQEDVAVGQSSVLVGVQHARIGQPDQSVERVGRADVTMLRAMHQLQGLHEKLDVADRTAAELHLTPLAPTTTQVRFNSSLGLPHRRDHVAGSRSENVRFRPTQQLAPQALRPGNDARFEQRLLLPHLGVRLQILQVRRDRRHEFPRPPPRSQPNVHAIEKAFTRHVLQTLDQPLRERQGLGRTAIGEEHQVNVRAVVQFLTAELSQRQDGEVHRVQHQLVTDQREARLNQAVGEQTELHGRGAQVDQPEGIARTDPQQLPPLKPPQGVHPRREVRSRGDLRKRVVKEFLATLQFGESSVASQFAQRIRVAQHGLRQIATGREQSDQHLDRARVLIEKLKQLDTIVGRLHKPLKVNQPRVRIGHFSKQPEQFAKTANGHHRRERFVHQPAQPVRHALVSKTEAMQIFNQHTARVVVAIQPLPQRLPHPRELPPNHHSAQTAPIP